MNITIGSNEPPPIIDVVVPTSPTIAVTAFPSTSVDVIALPGPPGPPGPEGGTPVVALPYDQWPPANPQTGTLYLRLAP